MTVVVDVEPCANTSEETQLRFLASATPIAVRRIRWDAGDGVFATWDVAGVEADGSIVDALVCPVDDSGGGTSLLVFGGSGGIRVKRPDAGAFLVGDERQLGLPYLLLGEDAVER